MIRRVIPSLLAGILALSTPALAQDNKDGPWYDVPAKQTQSTWVQWVAAMLFIIACSAVSLKNPHRSHLD